MFMQPTSLAQYEAEVREKADCFVACLFKGKATYARLELKTEAAARRAARTLLAQTEPGNRRPALIYAVYGGRSAQIGLVYP